jgi:NADH-quinone oxidoreductase subunit N
MLHDLALTTPLLVLLFAALFNLVVDPFLPPSESSRRFWGWFGAAASATAVVAAALLWRYGPHEMTTPAFAMHISASPYSLFFVALVSASAMLTHLSSPKYLIEQGMGYGEFYALLHFATFGAAVMVSAESLLTLFLGLEIMSMSVYVLVAFKRSSAASVEAGMKYFIMGSVASAFLLYGMAFLYGISGGTSYVEIQRALAAPSANSDLWLGLAVTLIVGAFLFKVAAVPFHMWAPDAYEGAPTPITGFMSTAVKTAGFAALVKLLYAALAGQAMSELHLPVAQILAVVGAITMTVGNLLALPQRNFKRMLAYSSVAHAGYLLIGCISFVPDASTPGYFTPGAAVPFYLVGYALSSLAAFGALTVIGKDGEELAGPGQLAGLGRRYPLAGAVLALAMISLAGVPPTLGFFGKLQIIREVMAIEDGKYLPFLILLVMNSVVSAYYYLKVTVAIYMTPEGKGDRQYVRETSLTWSLGLAAAGIVLIGLMPEKALNIGKRSAAGVRTGVAAAHVGYAKAPLGPVAPKAAALAPAAAEPAVAGH